MEEILLAILGSIGELLGELVLQLAVQFLVELFSRLLRVLMVGASPTGEVETKPHPLGTFVLYTLLGWLLGFLSTLLLPQHLIHTAAHRWLNLLITPLVAGGAAAWLGHWHDKHGRRVVGLDHFFNGWGFALAFAVARYLWCR